MSEQLKRENKFPDYTSPSIMLFDDVIDDLKNRCGYKMLEIKQHRLHGHWLKPENIASWVDQEVTDLVNKVNLKNSVSPKMNKKGIFSSIKQKIKTKDQDTISIESASSLSGTSSSSIGSAKMSYSRSFSRELCGIPERDLRHPGKAHWSIVEMQKLNKDEEKEILNEMAKGLKEYQNNIKLYQLEIHDEEIRDFLLLNKYNSMDINMKNSMLLER